MGEHKCKRLTRVEKDLICSMCSIAESNYDLAAMNNPVRGEGDYEGWTEADFQRADAIYDKLCDWISFAKRIQDTVGEAGIAARAILVEKGGK